MNTLFFRGLALMLAAASMSLARAGGENPPEPLTDQARAQAAMADLGQRLKSALVDKMQREGPVSAVDFCHAQAPVIAAAVSAEHGEAVGRTAIRYRNPAKAPSAWQEPVLAQFLQAAQAGTPPDQLMHVERTDAGVRVARGIAVEGPCLVCHGSHFAKPVRAAIDAHYPDDAARGFSEGDLRGLIWAEVPSAPMPFEDHRNDIVLSEAERVSLRSEMRWRMEVLAGAVSALARGDWDGLGEIAQAGALGKPRGVDFRHALPEGWFAMSRPMQQQFADLANEARAERRRDVALKQLGDASTYCVACHAAYRTQVATP